MDPVTKALTNIPLPLLYPVMLAAVGGAALVGSLPGRFAPVADEQVKEVATLGGAALLGASAAYAAVEAKKRRESAAVIDLYNSIVDLAEPYDLTPEVVDACGSKYGVNLAADVHGMCRLYSQYLEALIPSGDKQLTGDEAGNLKTFKAALGLSDEDAASCHVDVARRLYRTRSETRDREEQFETKKGFMRLVYVSQAVFGDVAAYLLSWRSHFKLTEAQLYVARRDNAKAIFTTRWQAMGHELLADREQLKALREIQLEVKMFDESAVELVRVAQRAHVEKHLTAALEAIRGTGKSRNVATAVSTVEYVLTYCSQMDALAGEEGVLPGLGGVTLEGGELAGSVRTSQLRDLFKIYLNAKMDAAGAFTQELDAQATQLATLMSLSSRETQTMRDEVASKLYRQLLKEEVTSRRIDAAEDPQVVLDELCKTVRFPKEAATELHRALYAAKMASLIQKGRLTAQDKADMARVQHILCIPSELANSAQEETCGRVLAATINEIFMAGAKPVPSIEMERLEQCVHDLAISRDVATQVLASSARDVFLSYLLWAEKEREDRREAASILKKLVQFNLLVVSPMLDRIRGINDASHTLSAARSIDDDDPRGQSEITVVDDMDQRSRVNLYKNYLMYTMEGDVVELPVGGMFRKKNNAISRHAEVLRLEQLAALLGLSATEVEAARHDISEAGFRAQARDMMNSGPMTQGLSDQLEEMRVSLGVSEEVAAKVIKATKSEAYGAGASTDGRLTLERVMAIDAAGGTVAGLGAPPGTLRGIYRRELERQLNDGKGNLDGTYMRETLPALLLQKDYEVKAVIKELVGTRRRLLLVQAVSQFRQKRIPDAMASLNNMLSCSRALPQAEPLVWSSASELRDLFLCYAAFEQSVSKHEEMQALLGVSDADAAAADVSDSSSSSSDESENKEFFDVRG